jgi:hypothetical protein
MKHSTTHHREVVAKFSDDVSRGTLEVLEFGSKDRAKRGISTALKCLGVTLVCLGIPGAHFILVPLGILLTPIIVILVVRIPSKILSSNISCPKCHAQVKVLSTQEKYPLFETCSGCHREILIRLAA